MTKLAKTKPRQIKNFGIAFLFLGLLMVALQLINFIITLLPAAENTVLDIGEGATVTVASLRDSYLTLVLITLAVYGGIWFAVLRSKNWARWAAVVLSILAAVIAVQGLAQAIAAGFADMIGPALSLAQLIAAGWVLALAFRPEVHQWYNKN